MSELFDIPESKSPRLIWMEKHGILTHFSDLCEEPWSAIVPMENDKGKDIVTIMQDSCMVYDFDDKIGYGKTQLDAIADLARKLSIKLWNEQ